MRTALKSILLIVFLLALLLTFLLIDFAPLVKADSTAQVNQAETVQPLIDQLRKSVRGRYNSQQISVSKAQAESLAGFVNRAMNQANADFIFQRGQLEIQISYKVNTFMGDTFLNVSALVLEGEGLDIDTVRIGDLALPGNFVLSTAEYLANTYTSSDVATKAIASVQKTAIKPSGIDISLIPLDALLREFKNIETGGSSQDTRLLKIKVAHYLRLLDGMYVPPKHAGAAGPSLAYYLQGVMKEAKVLSTQHEQSSATLENEAAIIALTIYAGSPRFATLLGDLSFAIDRIPSARPRPVLANRGDLSLHFLFSAAIKLMSEKGVSIAVGEFKELMDRGTGGSGYSFIDLAADMSGAHFAALAVSPESAQHLQNALAGEVNERFFMVSIEGLEEGMSKAEFTRKYTGVDSERYKQVVALIEQRIANLPINPSIN
jgi:hypothetical protein